MKFRSAFLAATLLLSTLSAKNVREEVAGHGMVQKQIFHVKVPRNCPTASHYSFASVGDQDYQFYNQALAPFATQLAWKEVINDINSSDVEFTLHVGDLGTPLDGHDDTGEYFEMCKEDSQTLQEKLHVIKKFKKGIIYTPGDNDWSDCGVSVVDGAFYGIDPPLFNLVPEAQLDLIRELFYPDPERSLGKNKLSVVRQENYPENVMFMYGDVLYVTIHITGQAGSNETNYCPAYIYDLDGTPGDATSFPNLYVLPNCDENQSRNAANAEWLIAAFNEAKHWDASAVVVAFQADLFVQHKEVSNNPFVGDIEQYTAYIQLINDLGCAFDGEVLVNHGDSHIFNLDVGTLYRCKNITRLETFGPFVPPNGYQEDSVPPDATAANTRWFKVNVDKENQEGHIFTFDAFDAYPTLPIYAPIEQYRFSQHGTSCMDIDFRYDGDYTPVVHGLQAPVVSTGFLQMNPEGLFPPDMTVEEIRTLLVAPGYDAEIDIDVPPGTVHLEIFSNANAQNIGDDFDIYLFGPNDEFLGYSFLPGQNERIVYSFPEPGVYKLFVDAYVTANPGYSNYEVSYWVVGETQNNLRITESPEAADINCGGKLCYEWRRAQPGTNYIGAITHEDDEGNVLNTTIIKIQS